MSIATLEEVQTHLPELVEHLMSGDEVVIMRDGQPVARLIAPELPKGVPIAGRGKGKLVIVSDDDEHSGDFEEPTA